MRRPLLAEGSKILVSPTRYKMISPKDESTLAYLYVMPEKHDDGLNVCYIVFCHALEVVVTTRVSFESILKDKHYIPVQAVPESLENKIMEVL